MLFLYVRGIPCLAVFSASMPIAAANPLLYASLVTTLLEIQKVMLPYLSALFYSRIAWTF
jgi:hypothetical protein